MQQIPNVMNNFTSVQFFSELVKYTKDKFLGVGNNIWKTFQKPQS